jgi:hypothetical protein
MRVTRYLMVALVAASASCRDAATAPIAVTASQDEILPGVAWIYDRQGRPTAVEFIETYGLAIFDGDQVLGRLEEVPRTRAELERRYSPRLAIIDGNSKRWPYGVVPYTWGPGFWPSDTVVIREAMDEIRAKVPGLVFVKRTNQSSYLRFTGEYSTLCATDYIGKQSSGAQNVYLGLLCFMLNNTTVEHEIFHALGAFHEQARCDRDTYVTVHTNNIQTQFLSQFTKSCSEATDVFEYEEGSIMHYPAFKPDMAINPSLPIMTSLRGRPLGGPDTLATRDWMTMDALYPLPPTPPLTLLTIENDEGHPFFAWVPEPGATSYAIDVSVEYHEYNEVTGSHIFYEAWTESGGTTSVPEFLDTGRAYSGAYMCWQNEGWQWNTSYHYFYVITPMYGSYPGTPVRFSAPIAPC